MAEGCINEDARSIKAEQIIMRRVLVYDDILSILNRN